MSFSNKQLLFIARTLDYAQDKENKRIAWRNRQEENIERWKNSVYELELAKKRALNNIHKNKIAIDKAEGFLTKLTSGKSQEWYNRVSNSTSNASQAKALEHKNKISSVETRIADIKKWINEGEKKIKSIDGKINDVESKISDVEYKLS